MMNANDVVSLVHTPSSYLKHVNRLFEVAESDTDAVYGLGARFDTAKNAWFVPEGVDPALFVRWLSSLRASSYGVILAKLWCVHCSNLTRVAGVFLPRKHETLEQKGMVDRQWIAQSNGSVPTFIDVLPPSVLERIRGFAPKYARIQDESWGEVFQNHCEHCGALHSDRDLYRDLDGALDYREIATDAISLHMFEEPFLGRSGDAIDVDQLETNPDLQIRRARQRGLRVGGLRSPKDSRR